MSNDETVTWCLEQGIGYAGKSASKAYVARIDGVSERYGFAREFLEPDSAERDHYNRQRYIRTYTWLVPQGLYELSAGGERWWRIVYFKDGVIKWRKVDADRADAIARLLSGGIEFEDARAKTNPAEVRS